MDADPQHVIKVISMRADGKASSAEDPRPRRTSATNRPKAIRYAAPPLGVRDAFTKEAESRKEQDNRTQRIQQPDTCTLIFRAAFMSWPF